MTVFLARGQTRTMLFNGPMRSGLVLDSRALLTQGYGPFQQSLLSTLRELFSGEWYAPDAPLRDSGMKIDIDTKRGATLIPEFFAGRRLAGEALVDVLAEYGLEAEIYPRDGGRAQKEDGYFTLSALDIRMYDLGYGAAMFEGTVTAARDLTLPMYRDLCERISSVLNDYQGLFSGMFEKVAKAVPQDLALFNFHDGQQKEEFWRRVSFGHDIGTLFWVHRLFVVECSGGNEFSALKDASRALVYSEQADKLEDVSILSDAAFYPGSGNSAVVYMRGGAGEPEAAVLANMVRVQNVFYVTAEDIDRDLFFLANELDRRKHTQDMRLLERQSRIIVEYQSKISLFISVYDDFDNHLDPQSLKVWHALETAWATRDRFRNLESKLDMIEKIYRRIMESLSHLYDKRLGTFVLAFTLISTLSVIVDTVDFTQGEDLSAPSGLRLVVLFAMAAIVLFLALRLMKSRE
ncbi:MAG: hypothetical protein ACK4PK_05715 [Alphaproteobacteria bacterium]